MLTHEDINLIYRGARVPEHIVDYVQSVSGAEPFLHAGYLCYVRSDHLIFVGFPLQDNPPGIGDSYESACEQFRPASVAIIAPSIWLHASRLEGLTEDAYYRLDLPLPNLVPDLAYMVRRAARELRVLEGVLGEEHERLVNSFVMQRELSAGHRDIFSQIPVYLRRSSTARVLEARKGDDLIAFDVVDLGSAHYGFHLFNFRTLQSHVPGASDLLFYEMAHLVQAEGKKAINLGLGINPGVRRFKEKWGAVPFLAYASAVIRRRRPGLLNALTRL